MCTIYRTNHDVGPGKVSSIDTTKKEEERGTKKSSTFKSCSVKKKRKEIDDNVFSMMLMTTHMFQGGGNESFPEVRVKCMFQKETVTLEAKCNGPFRSEGFFPRVS